ncbi:hypothetical protein [Pseudomonas serbica]|uniref:hypothetical protein n=1 Tax=Pseudomonas serbica TaxID=2965074 RepID=UPI00237C1911|nr:hypothetical protein [Pseudomonas serbica]
MNKPLPTLSPYRLRAITNEFRGRKHWEEGWHGGKPDTYNDKVAVLEAIEPAVMNKLLQILQLHVGGETVRNLAHLDKLLDGVAKENEGGFEAGLPKPHLRVYSLCFAGVQSHVYWPRLITLIQGASQEHEQQIRGFFGTVMDIDLDELLSKGQLPFEMPEQLRHILPRQAFSGIDYILDPQSGSWLREDRFSSTYELQFTCEEFDDAADRRLNCKYTIAHAGTLEEALALASLHLKSINPYFSSITDMREAQETLSTPVRYEIFRGPFELVVQSKITECFTDADEHTPDPALRKMIRYDNTWNRRPCAVEVQRLQQQNQTLQERLKASIKARDTEYSFHHQIEANEDRIKQYDFCVPNAVLEKMIFDTDQRLGNMHHLARYFSQDLGL